jgi:hypothetical protein
MAVGLFSHSVSFNSTKVHHSNNWPLWYFRAIVQRLPKIQLYCPRLSYAV